MLGGGLALRYAPRWFNRVLLNFLQNLLPLTAADFLKIALRLRFSLAELAKPSPADRKTRNLVHLLPNKCRDVQFIVSLLDWQ